MLPAKINSRVMENELRMWWHISKRAWDVRRRGADPQELALLIEEAQAIVMYTDWSLLKRKIQARIDLYDSRGVRHTAKSVVQGVLVAVLASLLLYPDWEGMCALSV
jgi:hypothetical protein